MTSESATQMKQDVTASRQLECDVTPVTPQENGIIISHIPRKRASQSVTVSQSVTGSHCQNMKSVYRTAKPWRHSQSLSEHEVTVYHTAKPWSHSQSLPENWVTVYHTAKPWRHSHCQKIESQSITQLNRDVTVGHCQKIESQSITQLKHDVTVGHGHSQFQNFDFRASGTTRARISHRQE